MPEDFSEFLQHLTDNAKTSLHHAGILAQGYGSSYVGTEHLLLGILAQSSSVGAKILADVGVTLDRARVALNLAPVTVIVSPETKGLSETAKLTLKMSWDVAKEYHQDSLGTEHILFSIVSQRNSRATILLRDMGVDINELMGSIDEYIDRQNADLGSDAGAQAYDKKPKTKNRGILSQFSTDLTAIARSNGLDPVIGRESEEERVITILSRRTKNNPVLIGEPGVGKTAIVEGLANRIAKEDVPEHLLDKKLLQLDLAGMVAGTKYRGEFEDRLKRFISDIKQEKNIILFIDEIHLLVGAGSAEGTIDAANILKPALARGEIRLIGATTIDEYRKHIEKDTALERRLQTIIVAEPNQKDTAAIIKGLREKYEKHHNVIISDEIIEDAVLKSKRYINDRFMPDKAIDVIDEAAALVKVKLGKKPSKLRDYTVQLNNLNEKMEEAVSLEDYERAALYKTRISQLSEKLNELKKESDTQNPIALTLDDVAKAVSLITGIPVAKLQKSETKLMSNLEKHLGKFLIGQQEAVKRVSSAIRRGRSGIASQNRPIGSFVFMGPTGVGKTEFAKVLAREVFGSDNALIKIDMSEFKEKHNAARLVGAPAGYVGYEDGGKLTDKIRRQPYSVVLFDEIEKAHPDIFNLLLQILEDGNLTDAKGRKVSFSNTIVVLTSNLGAERMMKESSLGFSLKSVDDKKRLDQIHHDNAEAAESELLKIMRPELVNRFDAVITFKSLTVSEVKKIFDNLIGDLKNRLVSKGISLIIKPSAKNWLIKKGYSEKFGARPLRRVLQDEIEDRIAGGLIKNEYQKGDVLVVGLKNKEIYLDVMAEK